MCEKCNGMGVCIFLILLQKKYHTKYDMHIINAHLKNINYLCLYKINQKKYFLQKTYACTSIIF